MKQEVLKEMSTAELVEKLGEEQQHLTKLKINHAVSELENPMKIRDYRRAIARIKTELHRRELEQESK